MTACDPRVSPNELIPNTGKSTGSSDNLPKFGGGKELVAAAAPIDAKNFDPCQFHVDVEVQ